MSDNESDINDTKVTISTPVDSDVTFTVTKLKVSEAISKPFIVEVFMYGATSDIPDNFFKSMIGAECSITINFYTNPNDSSNPQARYFSGIVGELQYAGEKEARHSESTTDIENNYTRYKLKLYPKFWTLKYKKDYCIFQTLKSLDIIEQIFDSDNQDISYNNNVSSSDEGIEKRDYCLQYGETTFDFLSRLMEEDGIFYYFEYSDSGHKITLGNDNDQFGTLDNMDKNSTSKGFTLKASEIVGNSPVFNVLTKVEFVSRMVPDQYITMEVDFKQPPDIGDDPWLSLQSKCSDSNNQSDNFTLYEYSARYTEPTLGDNITQRRFESTQVPKFTFLGESTSPFLCAGYIFTLEGPDIPSWNHDTWDQDYVVHTITHTFDFGFEGRNMVYNNAFSAFPKDTAFRPARVTERPKVYGMDTAIVMGPSGEEIYTDKYNRIKVRFNWDHNADADTSDDSRTCWIRTIQSWSGNGFGTLFTPRVGHEVLVSFIGGNPDRPIITGSLYNENNMPAYRDDEADYPKSGIRTQSIDNEDGFNELRFDDTNDEEEIYIHAQKDMNTEIENDETIDVQGNKTETIGGDYDLTVDGNFNINVGGNFTIIVQENLRIEVMELISIMAVVGITADTPGFIIGTSGVLTKLSTLGETIISSKMYTKMSGILGVSISSMYYVSVTAGTIISLKAGDDISITAGLAVNIKAIGEISVEAGKEIDIKAIGIINIKSLIDVNILALKVGVRAILSATIASKSVNIFATATLLAKAKIALVSANGLLGMKGGLVKVDGKFTFISGKIIASLKSNLIVDIKGLITKINC